MLVEIDKNSGFCFGVVRAISKAEAAVEELQGEVYSLGDIVHNRMEVQRLEALGLKTVTHEDMESLSGRDLFIRAHGEPPTTYRRAEELGIRVIDATCPVVALQGNTADFSPTALSEVRRLAVPSTPAVKPDSSSFLVLMLLSTVRSLPVQ